MIDRLLTVLEQMAAERRTMLAARTPEAARRAPIIGYFCNYTPRELILAAGAIPIRLAEGGSYDSKARGEKYVRADTCPFCKSCVGLFDSDPFYKLVTAIVAPSTCDQMRRTPEVIHRHFGVPVWQMALPRATTDASRQLFRREVKWLRDELEVYTGMSNVAPGPRRVTGEALSRAMLQEEEKRSLLRAINETRKADGPPVTETDILRLVNAVNLLPAESCAAVIRQNLISLGVEAGARQAASVGRPARQSDRRPRLMLAGSIIAGQDYEVVRMIEEQATIVTDLLCTGVRSFRHRLGVPLSDDPNVLITALADYYHDQPGCLHRRPNTVYYRLARELIAEYRVTGIIYKTLLFCDAYQLEAVRVERELGLPFLDLDTDYGEGNVEQLRTRIEAFVETLK